MPMTEQGFHRLTYDDILNAQIERAKLLFGEDIETSESSTFGKILRLYCLEAAASQELAEGVYLSAFPNTAFGVGLDRVCALAGISRNPATHAQHKIAIYGTAGATIDMGFLVSAGDVVFHTLNSYTISTDGVAYAIVECNDAGTVGNVAVGDITGIVNPDADVTRIEHTSIEKLAVDVETDYELRSRFAQALSGTGSGTLDSIKGAILRVSGVETVLIEENTTDAEVDGIPAHSFRCHVLAPATAAQAIAEAIYSKKPLGIGTAGDVEMTITDAGGGNQVIRFSWTEEVSIHVKCTISTNGDYSSTIVNNIKDGIISKLSAYTNGQDVTATSLYGVVYVDGVEDVTSLTISADGATYGTDTIVIAPNEVARAIASNIEVTINE